MRPKALSAAFLCLVAALALLLLGSSERRIELLLGAMVPLGLYLGILPGLAGIRWPWMQGFSWADSWKPVPLRVSIEDLREDVRKSRRDLQLLLLYLVPAIAALLWCLIEVLDVTRPTGS